MAEIVTIEGQPYVRRSPWVSWLLIFPTLGVYYFVWFYKLHEEAKQYLQDETIRPGLMTFSQFIPIWNWVTIYRFAEHIGATQRRAGAEETVEPILGLVLAFVASLHVVYLQSEFNKAIEAALAAAVRGTPTPPSTPPAVPPPPPAR
ncbi:MAG: DUF4234 domain-containing protein [Actinobacteria bacterium]|nr:MAG: DUF4234 domain-containing protein [Actinomycetota bacterium]